MNSAIYIRLLLSFCFISLITCDQFFMEYVKEMIPSARIKNITIERTSTSSVSECNLKCIANRSCQCTVYAEKPSKCILLRSFPKDLYTPIESKINASSTVILSRLMFQRKCRKEHQLTQPIIYGSFRQNSVHGISCLDIKQNDFCGDCQSGNYTIWLNSSKTDTITVYCDMETDGGGWTEVLNVKSNTNVMSKFLKINFKRWESLKNFSANGNYQMRPSALRELKAQINFTQIRFKCSIPDEEKFLHIQTMKNEKGKAALNWLINGNNKGSGPASCGSYERLQDDNSQLGKNCNNWYDRAWTGNFRTSGNPLLDHPFFIQGAAYWNLLGYIDELKIFECDNNRIKRKFIRYGDFWKIFVR